MKLGKIFIQIASYRDNQLLPTIKSCIENSYWPDNLVFCIAWQHSPEDSWDNLDLYKNDYRFKIIDIDYKQSQGVCWARNKIQQYYDDEEYTLQLDSHHRFVPNWDFELISMLKSLQNKGHAKPLLTTYLPSFNPTNDPQERCGEIWKLNFDKFTPQGIVLILPATIDDAILLDFPIKSRFYSAHFCFTLGKFCLEVQHDPNLYFHGEEISIAARAYTWGYDLFTPHKPIAWHEYTRLHRKKHWDDDSTWSNKDKISHLRIQKLFGIDGLSNDIDFGKYGFGPHRTLKDYENYTGICFKNRIVDQHTLDHKPPPPNPKINSTFKYCINVHKNNFSFDDYQFWAVIFEDDQGNSLHRQDLLSHDIKRLESDANGFYNIWRTFSYDKKPYKYIVWPFSAAHGWCAKIENTL